MSELVSPDVRGPHFIVAGQSEARRTRKQFANGIKFFEGNALPPRDMLLNELCAISASQLREEKKVWRPDETVKAIPLFFGQGRILVTGGPQEGKGTILFGLSEVCELIGPAGVGYVFIDGHHQEVPGEIVVRAIHEAEELEVPIFFDSTDYLAIGSRKAGRTISEEQQRDRFEQIVPALVRAKVPVAITAHNEDWAKVFLKQEIRNQLLTAVEHFPVYEIPRFINSPEAVVRFLADHGIDRRLGRYIAHFPDNYNDQRIINSQIGNDDAFQTVLALRRYPVLKELARKSRHELASVVRDENLLVVKTDRIELTNNGVLELAATVLNAKQKTDNLVHSRRHKPV